MIHHFRSTKGSDFVQKVAVGRLGLFVTALVLVAGYTNAQVDWPTIALSTMTTNSFFHPTVIAHAGDGSQRLFVTEQPGRVWIIQSNTVLSQPFLDITTRVLSVGAEQGLLGLAFPPSYATNGNFYADYTRS